MPQISIVIVTWNSERVLEDCVSSLFEHVPAENFELILVDNHSTDPAYLNAYESRSNIHVIRNQENLGFAKAVNIGLRRAGGNYWLILNPDMIFVSNPFPRLLKELNGNPHIGVIGPLLYGTDGLPQVENFYPTLPTLWQFIAHRSLLAKLPVFRWLARRFFHAIIGAAGVYFVDQIPGAFLLFNKDLFGTGPVLEEAYFIWMEDVDFCRRVHDKGLKVAVVADERITHIGGTSFRMWDEASKKLRFTRSYLTYLRLHFGFGAYLINVSVMLLNTLCIILVSPLFHAPSGLKKIRASLSLQKKVLGLIFGDLIERLTPTRR